MPDALEEHHEKVGIDGKTIRNLQFADDIAALAEEEHELIKVVIVPDFSLAFVGHNKGSKFTRTDQIGPY